MNVSFADFQKLDLRIGKIIEVVEVAGLNHIYKLKVDLGDVGERYILSGLKGYFEISELLNKLIVVLVNLEPKKIRGEISEGMLLACEVGDQLTLITPQKDVPSGTLVV